MTLTLMPIAIWLYFKAARENEDVTGNSEVPYQKLNTEQILGKITKKY